MFRWHYLAACLLIIGCDSSTEPEITVPLEREFTVGLNQTVAVEGTTILIAFEAVPADSRCPPMAVCFWAGDAEVHLAVWRHEGPSWWRVSLHTNPSIGPAVETVGDYTLVLVELDPGYYTGDYPQYVVTLRVELLEEPQGGI